MRCTKLKLPTETTSLRCALSYARANLNEIRKNNSFSEILRTGWPVTNKGLTYFNKYYVRRSQTFFHVPTFYIFR